MFIISKIIKALGYSLSGLYYAIRHEIAFVLEIVLFIILIPLALILTLPLTAKILMICSLLFILMAEIINTAIEVVIDRISLERHPLSKHAKDLGSALVLLAFIQAAIIWLAYLQKYWNTF